MVPNKELRLGKLEKGAGRRRAFSPRAGWQCIDILIPCVVRNAERRLVRITKRRTEEVTVGRPWAQPGGW